MTGSTLSPEITGSEDLDQALDLDAGSGASCDADIHGYHTEKAAYLKRLRRIEGQVKGIERMIENDTYCIDVLTQVSAVTRALQAVAIGLVDEHLTHCVVDAARKGGDEAEAKIREATDAIARLVKS